MPTLTPEQQRMVEELAARHRTSPDAVLTLLWAVQAGGGRQAQFSHPELGGMGQWSRGGMTMIGDMFNSALKARVDSLCTELSAWLERTQGPVATAAQSQSQSPGHSGVSFLAAGAGATWWPAELGTPASVGAQNDLRYAYFPASRRLAINHEGRMRIYATGEHQISGVSQQQGPDQSITLTSQHGVVRLVDLPLIMSEAKNQTAEHSGTEPPGVPQDVPSTPVGRALPPDDLDRTGPAGSEILAMIERLAELRRKDILTEEEFVAKKVELLSRL